MRNFWLIVLLVGLQSGTPTVDPSSLITRDMLPLPACLDTAGNHTWPIAGEIIDGFRPPAQRWSAGNRGIEIRTGDGEPVVASHAGTVHFAGQVGGDGFVTLLVDHDLKTTVGFVHDIVVARGDRVERGQLLAFARAPSIHFTARCLGAYIDPTWLLSGVHKRVRLVANPH